MRERTQPDWLIDLAARTGLESTVERSLRDHPRLELQACSTDAYDRLDFQLTPAGRRGQTIELELKAKLQPLSKGWRDLRPDVDPADLFVLDELALRKILDAGRYAFLLVRDVPQDRWVLWSAGDLLVASRVRHARRLQKSRTPRLKGKLLFDLSEAGFASPSLTGALDALVTTAARLDTWWSDVAPWPRTLATTRHAPTGGAA